jgi:hypothetical protein
MASRQMITTSSFEGSMTRGAMIKALAIAILTTAQVLLAIAAQGAAFISDAVKDRVPGQRRHRHADG